MTPEQEYQIIQTINQQAAIIRQMQQQMVNLQGGSYAQLIPTLNGLKEAMEKTERCYRLNIEAMTNLQTNAGAVYAEQIPGKRFPFWLRSDVTIPAASTTRQGVSTLVQGGGPFEIAQLMAVAVQNVPVATVGGATITRQLRFRPINSATADPLASPNPAAVAQPLYTPNITTNGVFDFFVEYNAASAQRRRMNAPLPSSFLFGNDRPAYLACGDLLDKTDNVVYAVDPLFPSFAWIGGVQPGTVTDEAQPVLVILVAHGVVYGQAADQKV